MDIVIGITGKDYVMVLADMSCNRSIFTLKRDEEKIKMIDDRKLLACGGDQASRTGFVEYVDKNMKLNALRTGLELSNHATANFVRHELARAIRSRGGAHQAQTILAGVDHEGPAMYFLDYLGSLQKVDFTCQGYAGYFDLSLLDRHWKKNMTLEEGKEVMNLCIEQLGKRFIINNPKYRLVAINETGKCLDEIIDA